MITTNSPKFDLKRIVLQLDLNILVIIRVTAQVTIVGIRAYNFIDRAA